MRHCLAAAIYRAHSRSPADVSYGVLHYFDSGRARIRNRSLVQSRPESGDRINARALGVNAAYSVFTLRQLPCLGRRAGGDASFTTRAIGAHGAASVHAGVVWFGKHRSAVGQFFRKARHPLSIGTLRHYQYVVHETIRNVHGVVQSRRERRVRRASRRLLRHPRWHCVESLRP